MVPVEKKRQNPYYPCFICGAKTRNSPLICSADKRALQDYLSHKGEEAARLWVMRGYYLVELRNILAYYRSQDWQKIRYESLRKF